MQIVQRKPDFEQDDDVITNLNATMIQLRERAKKAETEKKDLSLQMEGWLKAEQLTFQECGRLTEKNNTLIRECRHVCIVNKRLEDKVKQLNERIDKLISWKRLKIKKWVRKLKVREREEKC